MELVSEFVIRWNFSNRVRMIEHEILPFSGPRRRKADHDENERIHEFFNMKCDTCEFEFTSLKTAKLHYFDAHQIPDGYLKCCGIKFKVNSKINDHIQYHLDPESYKYI